MSGALFGLRVLDLSWGIAGPMATMLLADNGADVIKIEPPGGDPFRAIGRCALGYKTWQRGKRSAILDLKSPEDLDVFRALAAEADVLVESFSLGVMERLGIDYPELAKINPRLIYASVSAYGDSSHRDRAGYDLLVTARTGLQWEHLGWPEGTVHHTAQLPDPLGGFEVPRAWVQGPDRDGPIVLGLPTVSLGTFYNLSVAIAAALFARDKTGEGQRIDTSLLQGATAAAIGVWQRAQETDLPGFATWIKSSRAPKGHFECADGRWIHNWVPNPRFMLGASEGDTLNATANLSVHNDPNRFGTGVEETIVISHYQPTLAERVKKFTCDAWVAAGAIADIPIQEARSPETALADPLLLADGCVREIEDPELGAIRQVGVLIELEKAPCLPGGAAPSAGQHTEEIKAEARRVRIAPQAAGSGAAKIAHPLEGVRVIDLGLAIAGPFGCQVLADLGADVIKVNALHDGYWHRNHIAFTSNRNKRSVCLNLKDPRGMEVLRELVKTADVVQHNMRYDAAERLGVDYESLKAIKPDLVYCHTRGHDRGPRLNLPGNDQTGACIAGVQYEDGAMAAGGKPLWSLTSFGDTGNGYLSAFGIIEALYQRNRTGEGQFVNTAIVNAQLLNCSHVVARPDGGAFDRPLLDKMQTGFSALYGLYETADGWLAIAALRDSEWQALKAGVGAAELDDPLFATAALRRTNDEQLREALASRFRKASATQWRDRLDAAGALSEVSDAGFSQRVQDDPEFAARGWINRCDHPIVGRFEQVGLTVDFSQTPGIIRHAPLVVGEFTEAVLEELGYIPERIRELADERVVGLWKRGEPLIEAGRAPSGRQAAAAAKTPVKA